MKKLISVMAVLTVVTFLASSVYAGPYDPKPLGTSAQLTGAAWAALTGTKQTGVTDWPATGTDGVDYSGGANFADAENWAAICAYFWGPRADTQNAGLTGALTQEELDLAAAALPYTVGDPMPADLKPVLVDRWAVNDVATCIFIQGEATRMQNIDASTIYGGVPTRFTNGAYSVNFDAVANQVIAPIWSIVDACSERALLDHTNPLYPTPLPH